MTDQCRIAVCLHTSLVAVNTGHTRPTRGGKSHYVSKDAFPGPFLLVQGGSCNLSHIPDPCSW